ncbi:hypothetical protein AAHH21_13065 [Stenotrophomonas sp. BSUC-16]|uniref:hypothetical protein n=1 Tax=Stenotrophomonas sp. BSUC-16 TaxID=3156074 RepID=UPI00339970AC
MRIPFEIETHDRRLAFAMVGSGDTLRTGAVADLPGGATLEYQGSMVRRSVGIPDVLQFILNVSVDLEVGLLGAWLYDKVKGRSVEAIVINRRVVTEITEQGIRQILEEEIRSRK